MKIFSRSIIAVVLSLAIPVEGRVALVLFSLALNACSHQSREISRTPNSTPEIHLTTNLDRPTNLVMSLSDINSDSVVSVFVALHKINAALPESQRVKFWLLVPAKKFRPDNDSDPQRLLKRIEKQISDELGLSALPPEWKVRPMTYHRYAWMQDLGETVWLRNGEQWQEGFLDLNKPNTPAMPRDVYPSPGELEKIGYENADFATMAMQKIFPGFKTNYFRMPPYKKTDKNKDYSGNQGGNLETLPGNIPLVGNTAPPEMLKFLKEKTGLDPLVIDTSYLRVGHVDEITAIIPSDHACGFSLVIPDPLWGLKLQKDSASPTGVRGDSHRESLDYFSRNGKFTDGAEVESFDPGRAMRKYRRGDRVEGVDSVVGYPFMTDWFTKKSITGTVAIHKSAQEIAAKLKARGVCADLEVIPVPVAIDFHSELQYFAGDAKELEKDFFFFATPTVNMVVLGDHLMFANFGNVTDEVATKLKTETYAQLAKAGYGEDRIHLVEANSYHAGMGSIHCGTFTVRRPKEMEAR